MMVTHARQRQASPAVVNPALPSSLRNAITLDGLWDFATDPENVGEEQGWYSPESSLPNSNPIEVPGCWEAQGVGGPGPSTSVTPENTTRSLSGSYVGAAWYEKKIEIPRSWADNQVWLGIGGVHCQGWFWVNGTYVAHVANYCGSYKYDITDLVHPGETAVITSKVRNDVASGKGLFGWIQRFGGLYRGVELQSTPRTWIDNAYVEPQFDEKKATVNITLRTTASPGRTEYQIEVVASTVKGTPAGCALQTASLAGADTIDLAIDVALDTFRPWSPEQPDLYKAEILLKEDGKAIDGWTERFGVRKWEVRGKDFYLNNQSYFLRGYGDDYLYPLTLCSPASREEHKKHLQLAKDYGFNYVRHHTHCELPEFFDAADEIGIMVQPEMPYYGVRPSAFEKGYFKPKENLLELITHYRRYVSLSTYCTGNEGHLGSPIDQELYQLAKRLDPTRLFLHQDGGLNTPENSDFGTGPVKPWADGPSPSRRDRRHRVQGAKLRHLKERHLGGVDDEGTDWRLWPDRSRPFFAHEYLNLATDEDPRLEPKYSGAERPPASIESLKERLEKVGLSWEWGTACLDAGNKLQSFYQKQGLESARLDPECDGYIFWTIVDVGSISAQGLYNPFWEPKASTPEFFRRFNSPTVILAKLSPDGRILAAGDELNIEWWISHFDRTALENKTLKWKLVVGGNSVDSGELRGVTAEKTGGVGAVGKTTIKVPSLNKGIKADLIVELERTDVKNSWDLWLFPRIEPRARAGQGICASEAVYSVLAERYPGMTTLGDAAAGNDELILTDSLTGQVSTRLQQGSSVILLGLPGPNPGVELGWWVKNAQTGTSVARHPAFGGFPHEGYLGEQFFRMVQSTIKAGQKGFESVEPLMVGNGSDGYLLHAFQAKAGRGKILGTGLDLLSETPESAYLLNEFIGYVKSDQFDPEGILSISTS